MSLEQSAARRTPGGASSNHHSGASSDHHSQAFRVHGKVIAGFAAFNEHLSYLPFSGSVLGQLGDELDGYSRTKSALHFTADRPLPEALVRKLIKARLQQLDQRGK
jgi:uncharacterized protein YdhG (YjbR/CyaY superfamily)